MAIVGWTVLGLVFLDELFAVAAAAVWGQHAGGVVLALLAAIATITVWFLFASPKAPYGGVVVRPIVKVLVFSLASLGLWVAGHPGWAIALMLFSVVVNAAAQVPTVQALVADDRDR